MPPSNLVIRRATPDDLSTVQQLGHATYVDHFADLWSAAGLQRFLAQDFASAALQASLADTRHHQWLLAFSADGEALGLSKTNWDQANPLTHSPGAELQKLYLRRSAVGQGIGERLLEALRHSANERGQRNLWLDVLRSNTRAQRFYARQGFRELGEIPFATDLNEIGMLVMLCEL